MSTFQELFNASRLDIVIPDTSVTFPDENVDADEWLASLNGPEVERNVAFFDEQLHYYLAIQLESPRDTLKQVLSFLTHLQISFDASYISPLSAVSKREAPQTAIGFASPPARNTSLSVYLNTGNRVPPSIFPPATPHPIPSTTESDKKYVQSEGTLLSSGVWGDNGPSEMFQLLWSESKNSWMAIYKLVVSVSFVRMNVVDPLLCLTVSTTLREKPLPLSGSRQRLAELIHVAGDLSSDIASPISRKNNGDDVDEDDELTGLEEVNLLDSLSSAPTFCSENMEMPSTRLGPITRHVAFSLPPLSSDLCSPVSTAQTARSALFPTLRKSFRRTLKTASGFRVRMRTVFVPYVLIPEYNENEQRDQNQSSSSSASLTDGEWKRERKEAGHDESTVVLCVEVENSGESGIGFVVESIDVHISGEGAKTTLIRWGLEQSPNKVVFPIFIAAMEQYNLLYAVRLLESPEEDELGRIKMEMQRAVTIDIHGRPYDGHASSAKYPTDTFSSRWNCILDLSANVNKELVDIPMEEDPSMKTTVNREAMPTPPSPFPAAPSPPTPRASSVFPHTASQDKSKFFNFISGSKSHTTSPSTPAHSAMIKSPVNYRSPTSMLNPALQKEKEPYQPSPLSQGMGGFTPPSVMIQQTSPRTPTTYGPTSTPTTLTGPSYTDDIMYSPPPITPAYPAFPTSTPPALVTQTPVTSRQSSVGPSAEIRRDGNIRVFSRGAGARDNSGIAPIMDGGQHRGDRKPVVVSVGLLPLEKPGFREELTRGAIEEDMIYPNDKFTLDIFVFNQSSWIRRFEVSYPDGRTWRKQTHVSAGGESEEPGIMPLENRIRVGPLLPSTCQSVRMDFKALNPGVHLIEPLTLTDIETGYSVNLRSVMDIVVHELPDS